MRTINLLSVTVMVLVWNCLTACVTTSNSKEEKGDGHFVEKISLKGISRIKVFSGIDAEYIQTPGDAYAEIHASAEIIDLISVEQKNRCVEIGFKPHEWISGNSVHKVKVYVPEITGFSASSAAEIACGELETMKNVSLDVSSGAKIIVDDIRSGNGLSVTVSSGGTVKVMSAGSTSLDVSSSSSGKCVIDELDCAGNVSVEVFSGSNVTVAGECKGAELEAGSGGSIHTENLKAEVVRAESSSGGRIDCYESDKLTVRESSGGKINVRGRLKK